MAAVINRLPPGLLKQSGRLATLTWHNGQQEEFYYLAEREGYHIVSKEPYIAIRNFRDFELIRADEIASVRFAAE